MIIIIIIFLISLLVAFGILAYSAQEVEAGRRQITSIWKPNVGFRKIEKDMLYYTKDVAQAVVLTTVKYSLIGAMKTKKAAREHIPKMYTKAKNIFSKGAPSDKPSFIQKAVLESKTKIRRIRDKVKAEHE